jgi:predicted RNase H-like HicB family nuclease
MLERKKAMAKRSYPALLEPAEGGGFGVVFPDLPGCVSFGETYEAAVAAAEEALSLHLEGMAEDGERAPAPVGLGDPASLPEDHPGRAPLAPGHLWALISVEAPDESDRVNVYLQRSLLERIDRFTTHAGINRSAFFVAASRAYLGGGAKEIGRDRPNALTTSGKKPAKA